MEHPVNLLVSHVYNFGKQPVSLAVGGRWYADMVEDGTGMGSARSGDLPLSYRGLNALQECRKAA